MKKEKGKVPRSFYYYDLALYNYDENGNYRGIKNFADMYYDAFQYIANIRTEIEKGHERQEELEVPIDSGDRVYII